MEPLAKLSDLGFTAEGIPDRKRRDVTVYKIRTSKGWTYERFTTDAEVEAWAAKGHQPG